MSGQVCPLENMLSPADREAIVSPIDGLSSPSIDHNSILAEMAI